MVMLVWSKRAVRESSHTQRSCREFEQPAGTDFSQDSRSYRVLKLSRDPHRHASSLTHCWISNEHGLHPRIFAFLFVN